MDRFGSISSDLSGDPRDLGSRHVGFFLDALRCPLCSHLAEQIENRSCLDRRAVFKRNGDLTLQLCVKRKIQFLRIYSDELAVINDKCLSVFRHICRHCKTFNVLCQQLFLIVGADQDRHIRISADVILVVKSLIQNDLGKTKRYRRVTGRFDGIPLVRLRGRCSKAGIEDDQLGTVFSCFCQKMGIRDTGLQRIRSEDDQIF